MNKIIATLRKHQRMIVLAAALSVIVLYIAPIDQILAQSDNGGKNKLTNQNGEGDGEKDKCKEGKDKKHDDDCYRIVG